MHKTLTNWSNLEITELSHAATTMDQMDVQEAIIATSFMLLATKVSIVWVI